MNPTPKLGSPSKLLRESNKEKENILSSPATPDAEEPERHTIHPLLSPTKSTRLTLRSRVIILGTDNVEQRVPHLVGVEAEIVAVPGRQCTHIQLYYD